ncbi:serine hydrolase domain-containing protein [Gallicola sp. Sow4_E12]|uniref:serine hydrolase domain-containing protein n=1 Tax=Gallicola sp. Sow4_E12 TaxID=3438785 RepID=UPI003F92E79A
MKKKKMFMRTAVFFLGIFFLVSCKGKKETADNTTVEEKIAEITTDNPEARVAVSIMDRQEQNITTYGEGGKILSGDETVYEIGDLTKLFTASLLAKEEYKGRLDRNQPISRYIKTIEGEDAPTIKETAVHIAGFKDTYGSLKRSVNSLFKDEIYLNITRDEILEELKENMPEKGNHPFSYSNFGYALLGEVIVGSRNSEEDFILPILNDYVQNYLILKDTEIFVHQTELGYSTKWAYYDGYLSALGLTSTIEDMSKFIWGQLRGNPYYDYKNKEEIVSIENQGNIQAMGIGWMINKDGNYIFHNTPSAQYNSYVELNTEENTAVVVLTNIPSQKGDSAEEIGRKLMEREIEKKTLEKGVL